MKLKKERKENIIKVQNSKESRHEGNAKEIDILTEPCRRYFLVCSIESEIHAGIGGSAGVPRRCNS